MRLQGFQFQGSGAVPGMARLRGFEEEASVRGAGLEAHRIESACGGWGVLADPKGEAGFFALLGMTTSVVIASEVKLPCVELILWSSY